MTVEVRFFTIPYLFMYPNVAMKYNWYQLFFILLTALLSKLFVSLEKSYTQRTMVEEHYSSLFLLQQYYYYHYFLHKLVALHSKTFFSTSMRICTLFCLFNQQKSSGLEKTQ